MEDENYIRINYLLRMPMKTHLSFKPLYIPWKTIKQIYIGIKLY